jgi:hypothetical protein
MIIYTKNLLVNWRQNRLYNFQSILGAISPNVSAVWKLLAQQSESGNEQSD